MPLIEDMMRARRSVRLFEARVPPDELIERILAAAVTAPSASNKQPWRFFVVTDRERIDAMAEAVRGTVALIAEHVPDDSRASFQAYGDYFTRFESAPVVIVPIHRGPHLLSNLVDESLDEAMRARIADLERDSGLVSTSMALMNLLLAAHASGLGASAMTGPLVAVERLRGILGVPESWGMVALVPLGYPAERPASPGRKPLAKTLRWIR